MIHLGRHGPAGSGKTRVESWGPRLARNTTQVSISNSFMDAAVNHAVDTTRATTLSWGLSAIILAQLATPLRFADLVSSKQADSIG